MTVLDAPRPVSAPAPDIKALEAQVSGSSFYTAMRLMPEAERAGMYAIYAFCRQVDDIADDGARDARRYQAVGAGRPARRDMCARLQRDIGCRASRRRPRLSQCHRLGMRTAAGLSPAAADHRAVLYQDRADRRVGAAQRARAQRQSRRISLFANLPLHERGKMMLVHYPDPENPPGRASPVDALSKSDHRSSRRDPDDAERTLHFDDSEPDSEPVGRPLSSAGRAPEDTGEERAQTAG